MKKNTLEFAHAKEIRLGGYAGRMIDYTIENQLMDEATWAMLVDQFRRKEDSDNKGWRGEYWGKMMRGAAMTYSATGDEKLYAVLVRTVKDMLSAQEPSGRFSSYREDDQLCSWDMWARKYVILGMTYFLDICKNKALRQRIIRAITRHADYIIDRVGEGKLGILDTSAHLGAMNSASILEPFVKLYELTRERRYLEFAEYIINSGMCRGADLVALALDDDVYPYQFPVTKAYEMMSCYEGLLEYYRHTGNPDHLTAVARFVDKLISTDYTIVGGSGGSHEFLDNSTKTQTEPATADVMQETCVTVTLMKLCARLLCLTGDSRYAEYVERSGLNAMYGAVNNENQKMKNALVRTWLKGGEVYIVKEHDGYPFDSYSPAYMDRRGARCGGVQLIGGGRAYGCCVCIGSAGTALMGLFAVMKGDDGVYVNLYNDCRFRTEISGESVRLSVRSDPYNPTGAKIKVEGRGQRFTLALRVPSWVEGFSVSVNGESVDAVTEQGYMIIDRVWQNDRVEISFRAPIRMRIINGKIAFTRGAVALARDRRLDDITRPIDIRARDGKAVRARRVRNPAFSSNAAYEIQTRDGRITLCDYAQAGKDYDDEKSLITVWQDRV